MTRLAFGGKWSGFTTPRDASAVACVSASRRGPSSEFNATTPSPAAPRPRKVRRLISRTKASFMASIPGNQFVQVQYRPRDRAQGRKADGIDVRRQRRLAFAEPLAGARRISREPFQAAFVEAAQQGALFSGRRAIQRAIEDPCELPVEPRRPCGGARDRLLGEHARGFDVDRIVEQIERLERCVRRAAADRALLARRRIEVQEARVQERSLPGRVYAAPVEVLAVARRVLALRKVQRGEIASRLDRADAGTAELVVEQA